MDKVHYSKKAQYRIPAWDWGATYMDGIYINGTLFENNIPVHDGMVRMSVTPQYAHWVEHWANFGFPTYQNGQVIRSGHKFWWGPGASHAQTYDLRYNGHPYGMGLNTIAAQLGLSPLPISRDIVYDVIYVFIMEVGS